MFGFAAGKAHFLSTFTLDHGLAWTFRLSHDVLAVGSTAPLKVLVLSNDDILFHPHVLFELILGAELPHVSDSVL